MDTAAKKQIMREAAVAPHLNNHAYSTIPTGQAFSSDIDRRVEHYLSSSAHKNALLSVSARGMTIHPAARTSSRAYHQAEIQQLSDLLMYHTRHRWPDDVFSLTDKSVSLKGIYRQSGHIMRRVSRNVTHSTDRDCVAYQFARAVHWATAEELERLIGAKSVSLSVGETSAISRSTEVRLEPLEVGLAGRLSGQKFKSGLRSKLREVMESRLIEIRELYN